MERTGEGGDGGLEAVHARAGAELTGRRDSASGGAAEDVPVLVSDGCIAIDGIDEMERTWWRKGIKNYRLRRGWEKKQSPLNDETAISAYVKRRKAWMK